MHKVIKSDTNACHDSGNRKRNTMISRYALALTLLVTSLVVTVSCSSAIQRVDQGNPSLITDQRDAKSNNDHSLRYMPMDTITDVVRQSDIIAEVEFKHEESPIYVSMETSDIFSGRTTADNIAIMTPLQVTLVESLKPIPNSDIGYVVKFIGGSINGDEDITEFSEATFVDGERGLLFLDDHRNETSVNQNLIEQTQLFTHMDALKVGGYTTLWYPLTEAFIYDDGMAEGTILDLHVPINDLLSQVNAIIAGE
jgi:hypothetical protein